MAKDKNLILVGTAHFDLRGKQRLKKLLDYLAPDILTLECSKEKREFGQVLENRVKKIIEQKGVDFNLLKKSQDFRNYELNVCDEYVKEHKIPLYDIDIFLPEEKDMWEKESEKFKTAEITNESLEEGIKKREGMLKDPEFLLGWDMLRYADFVILAMFENYEMEWVGERDKYMAEQLTNLTNCYPDSRIVHVGGSAHIVDYKKGQMRTMRSFLPQSKVYFLDYADRLE